MKYQIITISGSRTITNTFEINLLLDQLLVDPKKIEVRVGDAKGVDEAVMRYCQSKKIPYTIHYAEWDKYGKSAGPRRNLEMVNGSDQFIAIWDGTSLGTKSAINFALELKIPSWIHIMPDKDEDTVSALYTVRC